MLRWLLWRNVSRTVCDAHLVQLPTDRWQSTLTQSNSILTAPFGLA